MNEEAMRKAFEAWARVSGRTEKQLRRLSNGDYEVTATHWEWQAWQAATRAAVPAGWKVVPCDPTDAMVQASLHLDLSYMPIHDGEDRACIYKAMLAAAPEVRP